MVEIRPFKALVYDWDEVDGDPAAVTSPPYDVLTDDEVQRLKKRSLHNVTRLSLPEPAPGKEESSKYREAAKLLKRWKREGILHRRKDAAYFAYDETHMVDGEPRTVRGFFGLLRLDPEYADVLPHERTHKGPIADRLDLLRATDTDLEPIEFLFDDPSGDIMNLLHQVTDEGQVDPLVAFKDPQGTSHRVWPVEDGGILDAITASFATRKVYIADGHHRYATAIQYASERHEQANGGADSDGGSENAPFDYKLALFVPRQDPALAVYATHRLVSGLEDAAGARERLRSAFKAEALELGTDAQGRADLLETAVAARPGEHRFAVYWGDGSADLVVVPSTRVDRDAMDGHSDAWKTLDLAVLHHHVLPKPFGIDDANAGEHLRYTRIPEEAIAEVDAGNHQVAIFVAPTPLDAVTAVADAGDHMPQKSTYFQPKAVSGLLFSGLA